MKLITVVGARPQFIKAAPLSTAFKKTHQSNYKIQEKILHTGQHFDPKMSDQFFSELKIAQPDFNLGISGGTHGSNTGRMLIEIEKILIKENPDGLIVFGDTDSTLAGALAACKINIPIFHIEAGLRSFNVNMPEELNRKITDHLASVCFAPTETAVSNLIKEGIDDSRIVKIGDIMLDAARFYGSKKINKTSCIFNYVLNDKKFALATIHRKENSDNKARLNCILLALGKFKLPVFLPLHPRTKNKIKEFSLEHLLDKINVIEPLGYLDMLQMEKYASLVITDSGGVQKEAFFQSTPCVTIRHETEWLELLKTGWNILANPDDINEMIFSFEKQLSFNLNIIKPNLYGDGHTAEKIVEFFQSII